MDFPEEHEYLKGELEVPRLEHGYSYSFDSNYPVYAVYKDSEFEFLTTDDRINYQPIDLSEIPTNCQVYCYAEKTAPWTVLRKLMNELHPQMVNSIFMAYEDNDGGGSPNNAYLGIRSVSRTETDSFIELRYLKNGDFAKIDSGKTYVFSDPEDIIGYLLHLREKDRDIDVIVSAESMVSTGDYLLFYSQVHQWIKWQTCLPLEKRKIDTRSVEEWINNNVANQNIEPTVITPVD